MAIFRPVVASLLPWLSGGQEAWWSRLSTFHQAPTSYTWTAIVPLNEAKGWSRTYLSKLQVGSYHVLTSGLNTIHIQSPGEGASVHVFWKVFANIYQEFKNYICLVTQQSYFSASSPKQGAL